MFQTIIKVGYILIVKCFVIIGMSKKTLIVIVGYGYYYERVVPTKYDKE